MHINIEKMYINMFIRLIGMQCTTDYMYDFYISQDTTKKCYTIFVIYLAYGHKTNFNDFYLHHELVSSTVYVIIIWSSKHISQQLTTPTHIHPNTY